MTNAVGVQKQKSKNSYLNSDSPPPDEWRPESLHLQQDGLQVTTVCSGSLTCLFLNKFNVGVKLESCEELWLRLNSNKLVLLHLIVPSQCQREGGEQ